MSKDYTYLDFIEKDIQTIDSVQIANETKNDIVLCEVMGYVMNGWPVKVRPEVEYFNSKKNEVTVERGCVMWGYRVIIPVLLRQMVLKELHTSHFGIVKMTAIARSYVWWPGLDADIEEVSKTCKLCLENSGNQEEALHRFLMSYRTTPHSTTGCTPAELQCGRLMKTKVDLVRPSIRSHVLRQQFRQQLQASSGNRDRSFSYGNIVMAKDTIRHSWVQAQVIHEHSPSMYFVKTIDGRLWMRHVDQLKATLLTEPSEPRFQKQQESSNEFLGISPRAEMNRGSGDVDRAVTEEPANGVLLH